ncbi:hypothetical protein LOK49_LG08G03187 [Camellia lanceoleosa]|uniref:Uncharacterized protein n=1 Tax=Camellia lanceoleosa TaxID=1840588 RepID=A0ACC0GQT6_9ERIC|nr:hypothetical protein LOK49_LG08G03187 [Camellia lanceoleosa]
MRWRRQQEEVEEVKVALMGGECGSGCKVMGGRTGSGCDSGDEWSRWWQQLDRVGEAGWCLPDLGKGRPKDYYCDREREAYEEDFERIYELSIIKDEYSTYYSNLCHANCDPNVVVAEGKGCAENKGFEGCGWKKEKEVHKKFRGGRGVMVDKEDHIISEIFRNEAFWLPVVEKICKRLEGWKRALLSKGRRIAKTMENLLKDFLWEGKDEGKKQTLYRSSIASLASSNLALIAWNFSFSRNLTEREVGDLASLLFLIDHLSLDRNASDKQVYLWVFSFDLDKWNDISQSDIISAMREVLNYVPLKEDCKMQLTLELSRLKCYHILDSLTLEVVKDIKIQELHRFVDDVSSDESKVEDASAMLDDFANDIVDGLHVLSGLKGDESGVIEVHALATIIQDDYFILHLLKEKTIKGAFR